MHKHVVVAILILAAVLLAGCTLSVTVDLTKLPTPTPGATATAQPVETATPKPTETLTAPATDAPTPTPTDTATALPGPTTAPTAAATPTPAAATVPVVNVPLLAAKSGDPALDANNWAMVWGGAISPGGGYWQLRLVGATDGARAYMQVMAPAVAGDVFTLTLGSRTYQVRHDAPTGWQVGDRCGIDGQCRGWTAYAFLPWGQLGGAPIDGDVWPLTVQHGGVASAWRLRWGLPDYAGRMVDGAQVVTSTLSADAMVGGGTDCGAPAWPLYFPAWGGLTWRDAAQVTVQTQWDVADWPCYVRYYMAWDTPILPEGATVVSATVTLRQFGNAGYGAGYAPDGTGDTVLEVLDVAGPVSGATWDGGPTPIENLSRVTVRPIDVTCPPANLDSTRTCRPGVPVVIDVTEAVKRAIQDGRGTVSVLVSTSAGQYHSGKHFWAAGTAEQPVVSIAYTLPGEPQPTWTPVPVTPTTTPTPTATSLPPTATSTATATSTTTPTRQPTATAGPTIPVQPAVTATPQPSTGRVWYLGLGGNDANAGTASAPLRTFARAWAVMRAGDTLLIQDGTYTEPIQPLVYGREGAPVTIKAINDGKVIIDGRGQTIPLKLGDTWPGDNRSWFVVEGIVARNGTEAAVRIRGDHIILRRVSAYDAGLRSNSAVMLVGWSSDVLLEDVIAAGTGRKSILIFTSERVTVRRAFTQWVGWDGQTPDTCAMGWPAGNGINPYNSKYVIVENALVTGPVADAALRVTINHESVYSPGMQVLGSIAVGAGMDAPGKPHAYPLVNDPACYVPPGGPPYYAPAWGMGVYGQGDAPGVVFRDVLAVGNAGWGFASLKPSGVGVTGGTLDHATLCNNNTQPGAAWEKDVQGTYGGFFVTNSQIPGFQDGVGARLANPGRYVDGVLTDAPLLPWPMQDRAASELGVDVSAMWTQLAGACN